MVQGYFDCYNNMDDIDRLAEMVERVAHRDYRLILSIGEYVPVGFEELLIDYYFKP